MSGLDDRERAELEELRALFKLQWTRSREADARWQAEDPEARKNTWPDLGKLLRWLMDKADEHCPGCTGHDRIEEDETKTSVESPRRIELPHGAGGDRP
jgi:hypothetical protein